MKRSIIAVAIALCLAAGTASAQKVKGADVPGTVKSALVRKFPSATNVSWEKEKGNFEANWGGKSKEDNSVIFTPDGQFVEMVVAIPRSALPSAVAVYVKEHYKGAAITEAGKVTDASGKTSYEAEVKGKDLLFDETGNYIKQD